MKKYRWVAESNDRSFEDESRQEFTSKEECYNDMRSAALEKMKWNTEFCDVEENDTLGYKVHFSKNKIINESYSGVYTYEIKEVQEMKTIELTDEQIKMISHAISVYCSDMESSLLAINSPRFDNTGNIEKYRELLTCKKLKYQTLKNYVEQV
jgi:hypothetical protein